VTRRIRLDLLATTLLPSLAAGATFLFEEHRNDAATYETPTSSPYVQHRPALAEACSAFLTSVMHDAQDSLALKTWWRHWVEDDEYPA
jgi:hypothetical protein